MTEKQIKLLIAELKKTREVLEKTFDKAIANINKINLDKKL